jgi:hypothetical protein
MIPILGVIALLALVGCNRREDPASTDETSPCQKGWDRHSVTVEQADVLLCHQDANKDGLYQKAGDKLALKIKDRFVLADDKDFPSFQQKFRLPNFEGLSVRKWAQACGRLFPQGPSGQDAERFRSLQGYFQKKNISMEAALTVAEKIPWLNEKSRLVTWEKIGPEEKMDTLALVGLLMGVRQDKQGFYAANSGFIDTVLQKISEGRLRLQKQTKIAGQAPNELTELTGRERSAGYHREKNLLFLGLPLDPMSLVSSSNYLHELFHFYQDALRLSSNFLEVEFSAYAKQGEFIVHSLQPGHDWEQYRDVEDFMSKEYPDPLPNPFLNGDIPRGKPYTQEKPVYWGVRYAQARFAQQEAAQTKAREVLEELIHRYYYFQVYLSKNAAEPARKALQMIHLLLVAMDQDIQAMGDRNKSNNPFLQIGDDDTVDTSDRPHTRAAQAIFHKEVEETKKQKAMALRELEQRLEVIKHSNGSLPSEAQVADLVQRFGEILQISTYLIELDWKRDRFMTADILRDTHQLKLNLGGSEYLEVYRALAKYQPLKYQATTMDGVD